MMRCSPEAFAKCPTSHLCGNLAEATFTDDSECATFNKAVEDQLPDRERIKTALVKLLYGHVPCEGPSWQEGGCPDRVHGNCGEFGKLSPCVAEHLAEYLIANGVLIQECNKMKIKQPMTNIDRIRSMSDEELAAFLGDDDRACPPNPTECSKNIDNCDGCWLEWLRQPAEEVVK